VTAGPAAHPAAADRWPIVRRRVIDTVATPGRLLVVSDFDGTLAPITADPGTTRILPLGRRALRRLARICGDRPERLSLVILSGRGARDVAGRVRVGGLRYFGNHGLESGRLERRRRAERLAVELAPGLADHATTAHALGRAVAASLGRPDWLFVEDKGVSVAFHFRQAADGDAARAAVLAAIDDAETALGRHGLARLDGRRVVELAPADGGGKGAAVERLIREEDPSAAIALGDDVSDAMAFRAVSAARADGRLRAGLAIAIHGAAETPPVIVDAADLVLPTPRDAARVLSLVARLLTAETIA
jgi:trehalose 6-phosphate phosphatase